MVKSVLGALANIDFRFKWGKHGELKWRNLNKLIEATKSEIQQPESITEHPSVSLNHTEYTKQLESKIINLNKKLLGTSTYAVSTSADNPSVLSFFSELSDQALKEVTQSDPSSEIVKYAMQHLHLSRECSTCCRFNLSNKDDYIGICEKDQRPHEHFDCCDDWESKNQES